MMRDLIRTTLVLSSLSISTLGGCFNVASESCTEHSQCRDAFGFGATCAEAGACEVEALHKRCTVFPEGGLEDGDALVIASMFDHSAKYPRVLAARLAVQQVNDRAGLDGRPVAIIECDLATDPAFDDLDLNEATADVSTYLSEMMGVPAVIGPASSGRTEVAYEVLSRHDTMLISPSATSPALTALDGLTSTDADPGLLWRTAPPDSLQGQVIATEMRIVAGATKASVIAHVGAYGEGLAEVFAEHFEGAGGISSMHLFESETDLTNAIVDAGLDDSEQVLFISGDVSDAIAFFNGAAGLASFADKGVFLTDGARKTELITGVTGTAQEMFARTRGTVPRTPVGRPAYDTFATNYRLSYPGRNPNEDGFTAHAYDAAWLVLYGAAFSEAELGEVTGTGIARALRRLSSGPSLGIGPNDWSTVRGHMAAGESVDIEGASGTLDFDPITGETAAAIDVWFIDTVTEAFYAEYCWDPSVSPEPVCTGPAEIAAESGDE